MSILDRMTDEDLRDLVASKDNQIKDLQALCDYYRNDRDRLYNFSQVKTKRIIALSEEICDLKKAVSAWRVE